MTENEILDTTKEYYSNINKKQTKNKERHNEQTKFWEMVLKLEKLILIPHGKIHPDSNISITWLKNLEEKQ